jgi:hypothetical protein
MSAYELTVDRIRSLEAEAASAGDWATVTDCQHALGTIDSSATPSERRRRIREARSRLRALIGAAQ